MIGKSPHKKSFYLPLAKNVPPIGHVHKDLPMNKKFRSRKTRMENAPLRAQRRANSFRNSTI
jgi:hypothetical protein